jgi:hypothetical protein
MFDVEVLKNAMYHWRGQQCAATDEFWLVTGIAGFLFGKRRSKRCILHNGFRNLKEKTELA